MLKLRKHVPMFTGYKDKIQRIVTIAKNHTILITDYLTSFNRQIRIPTKTKIIDKIVVKQI